MRKVKAYAKINLSLNIVGEQDGYHLLDSVVTTVDLFDTVTVRKRNDGKITINMRGVGANEFLDERKNNAYKAAVLFKETYSTGGVDVTVNKRIPLGGGLGGSSADVSGVLSAMKELFHIESDVKPLADKLGSDSGYLLEGGFARISGRGEKVSKINADNDFWVVLLFAESGVNTAECFKKYDENPVRSEISNNDELENAIAHGDIVAISKEVKNSLSFPAEEINGEVKKNLKALKDLSPLCASVSGSGATTFALFETKELTLWAVDKLRRSGYDAMAVKTVSQPYK